VAASSLSSRRSPCSRCPSPSGSRSGRRGPRGATPGKRLLGLRVSRLDGGQLSWPGSLLRSAVKIAVPWELAHTGVWNSLAWPGPEAPVNAVLFSVANGLLVLYVVMLFVGARRPPYDRLAGSIVPDQLGR
jgi:uncharacterized RDD family membrane protein YckC